MHYCFASDQVQLAGSEDYLQRALNTLHNTTKRFEIKLSYYKQNG